MINLRILRPITVVVDSLTSTTWPGNWTGEVDEAIVSAWTEGVDYERRIVELTADDQRQAFLTAFADQAMAAAEKVVTSKTSVDDTPGADELASKTVVDLRKIAHELGLDNVATMRKADLIAAIAAAQV